MTFKRFGAVIVTILLAVCQLSCNSIPNTKQDVQKQESQESNILSFRITWKDYSGRGQAIQKIVDAYHPSGSNQADIRLIGGDEDMAAIQTMLETESETIFMLPYRYIQYFGSMGLLSDLTSDFKGEASLFYPSVWELGMVKRSVYGIPWLGHAMCLLYNKTLQQSAGKHHQAAANRDK